MWKFKFFVLILSLALAGISGTQADVGITEDIGEIEEEEVMKNGDVIRVYFDQQFLTVPVSEQDASSPDQGLAYATSEATKWCEANGRKLGGFFQSSTFDGTGNWVLQGFCPDPLTDR